MPTEWLGAQKKKRMSDTKTQRMEDIRIGWVQWKKKKVYIKCWARIFFVFLFCINSLSLSRTWNPTITITMAIAMDKELNAFLFDFVKMMRIYTQPTVFVFVPSDWNWWTNYLSLSIWKIFDGFSWMLFVVGVVVVVVDVLFPLCLRRAFTTAVVGTQEENVMVHIEQNRRRHIIIPPRTFSETSIKKRQQQSTTMWKRSTRTTMNISEI